jgi:hypothetical protein
MTMASDEKPTINISGTIGGSASGQIAIGQDITQIHTEAVPVSEADRLGRKCLNRHLRTNRPRPFSSSRNFIRP